MKRHLPRAFSYLELLVVISILVILVALLLPSFARMREMGRSVECLANLRTIGSAYLAYSADHTQTLMPASIRHNIAGNWVTEQSYATTLSDLGYVKPPNQNPAFPESNGRSPFRCPSGLANSPSAGPSSQLDPEGARFWRVTSNVTGKTVDTWYGINAATWYWDGLPARRIPNDQFTNDFSQGSYLQIMRGASQVVLLFDGYWMNVAQTNKPERINARHGTGTAREGRQTNILFCDGHAMSAPMHLIPTDFAPIAGNKIKSLANRDAFNQLWPEPKWVFGSAE